MYITDYSKLDVDTSDVWKYEVDDLKVTPNVALYDKLVGVIEPIISLRMKPFLEGKTRTDSLATKLYNNYPEKYKSRSIDYFEFDGNYYEYNIEASQLKDFSFLFTLKLRQYQDSLSAVDSFLYHHLKVNFKGDLKKNKLPYLRFLAYTMQDFEKIQTPKKFNNWGKNFTSSKFKKDGLPFDIQRYIDLIQA